MMLRVLLLMLAILPLSSNLDAGMWSNITNVFNGRQKPCPPSIRVLLVHDLESVNLEVRGKYSLYDPYTNSYISTRLAGKSRYIQTIGDGLKWGEAFPGLYQIKIKPEDPETVTAIEGRYYIGDMYVYDIGGTISIVNQISVEDYVRSILANYESASLHPETLAAMAIVARTNAYFQAMNPKNTYWAVDAKKVGFNGDVQLRNRDLQQAINMTRYMIMSRTGIYEGVATPFPSQFGPVGPNVSTGRETQLSQLSLDEADQMARDGEHAAQILMKAFPQTTIMMMQYFAP